MKDQHGGNILKLAEEAGCRPEDLLDFSANINPLGPPDWLRPLISSRIHTLVHYPDPHCTELITAFARRFNVDPDEVIAGNGSTEILYLLPRVIRASRALIWVPSYADYATAVELCGLPVEKIFLKEQDKFTPDLAGLASWLRRDDLVILGQPNNPTGCLVCPDKLIKLAMDHPHVTFIVDESFQQFVEDTPSLMTGRPDNIIVLLSLTKFYAIPGLRLGCAVASRDIILRLKKIMPPWSVNTIAQMVGAQALNDKDYAVRTRHFVTQERQWLQNELEQISGLTVFPGSANFLLVRIHPEKADAESLAKRLLKEGIAIRVCDNFEGLGKQFFRIAVRTREENIRFCNALCKILGGAPTVLFKRKARPLMIQGTGSNAGKSVLVAAFCRILLQDGYSVAPFKAQNMSLNSYVTRDGLEMGRAQVVQAQAARLDPDARMNPVLLKPTGDLESQIIVRGKPVGTMDFQGYIHFNTLPFAAAKEDFEFLAARHDAIILEGAGSPAEVNLRDHDIVNMNMALYARTPVLLAGDIDRGGVYASFIGTMEVLTEAERRLVAGFLINRFRGQKNLLKDANRYVENFTGRKMLGVVPYLEHLGLPDEDSVSFKEGWIKGCAPSEDHVVIAVIDLPHISNFTDFDALGIEPDVCVKIVRSAEEMGEPDAVIVPGSKNVMADLSFLKKSGFDRKLLELARKGKTEIIGICGGFQMLGDSLEDSAGIESAPNTMMKALGMLAVATRLVPEKTLKRIDGRHLPSGLNLYGYEIHHGRTENGNLQPIIEAYDRSVIGLASPDGLIWGTYLHGLFDADVFRRWFIDRLRIRRGLSATGQIRAIYDLEPAFERLAATVRENVDMKSIYKIMGLA